MKYDNRLKVVASRDLMFGQSIQIRIGKRFDQSGPWAVAQPLVFKVRTPEEEGTEVSPCMELLRDDAQAFMDELWQVGIRPTEGTGSAGSLAATQKHLEDMRALVFKSGKPT